METALAEKPGFYIESSLSASCCFSKRSCSPYLSSIQKRSFDIVLCVILLIPICVLLCVAILSVIICDGFPVIFLQKRAGKHGIVFTMPKVRTLRKESHPDMPSYSNDLEALTFPLSKVLRKYRLDELPQVFSILSGRMSFVGPRPELVSIAQDYTAKQMKRLYANPGLTGLWQIKGSREKPIHHSLRYDLYYLRKASLWLDLKILAGTLLYLLKI